jgi:hypothetical protein
MCSPQINKNITSKQSSHLLVFLVDAPDARRRSLRIKNLNVFWERTHQTLIFSSQITYVLGVMEQEVKLVGAKVSKRE